MLLTRQCFSDWCYLAAAGVFAAMVPLNALLLRRLASHRAHWPVLTRWTWPLGDTAALFGVANALTLPLLTWLGPGGIWLWGVAAALAAAGVQQGLLLRRR